MDLLPVKGNITTNVNGYLSGRILNIIWEVTFTHDFKQTHWIHWNTLENRKEAGLVFSRHPICRQSCDWLCRKKKQSLKVNTQGAKYMSVNKESNPTFLLCRTLFPNKGLHYYDVTGGGGLLTDMHLKHQTDGIKTVIFNNYSLSLIVLTRK